MEVGQGLRPREKHTVKLKILRRVPYQKKPLRQEKAGFSVFPARFGSPAHLRFEGQACLSLLPQATLLLFRGDRASVSFAFANE